MREAEAHIAKKSEAKKQEKGKRRENIAASKESHGPELPELRYKISHMQKPENAVNVPLWLSENAGDFALTVRLLNALRTSGN